jgi:hypothetical protein
MRGSRRAWLWRGLGMRAVSSIGRTWSRGLNLINACSSI